MIHFHLGSNSGMLYTYIQCSIYWTHQPARRFDQAPYANDISILISRFVFGRVDLSSAACRVFWAFWIIVSAFSRELHEPKREISIARLWGFIFLSTMTNLLRPVFIPNQLYGYSVHWRFKNKTCICFATFFKAKTNYRTIIIFPIKFNYLFKHRSCAYIISASAIIRSSMFARFAIRFPS